MSANQWKNKTKQSNKTIILLFFPTAPKKNVFSGFFETIKLENPKLKTVAKEFWLDQREKKKKIICTLALAGGIKAIVWTLYFTEESWKGRNTKKTGHINCNTIIFLEKQIFYFVVRQEWKSFLFLHFLTLEQIS